LYGTSLIFLTEAMFMKISQYCHGTTSFINQINENLEFEMEMDEEIEKLLDSLVDERMKSFLKDFIFPQTNSNLIQNQKPGSFEKIEKIFNLNLQNLFPECKSFTYCHEAYFLDQGMHSNLKTVIWF